MKNVISARGCEYGDIRVILTSTGTVVARYVIYVSTVNLLRSF